MKFSQEDFQKARRISRAIQQFLIQAGMSDARTTDVYETLARQGLIEKDRHQGYHFRAFLCMLKDANLLQLIPQCSFSKGNNGNEWYFNPVPAALNNPLISNKQAVIHHRPALSREETILLIKSEQEFVAQLPERTDMKYTSQELEIRKNYPRAYELWTTMEYEILERVYRKCKNIDVVATLLKRQPHMVKEKIGNRGLE